MEFSEFAQLILDARKARTGSGDHSSICDFAKELLKAGLSDGTDTYFIDKLKDDTFRKYYSGGRKITKLANDILVSYKNAVFAQYIKDTFKKQHYPMICELLKEKSIIVEPKDVPKKLAEIYRKILEEAAVIDPSASNAISISRAPKSIIPRDDITKIRALIKTLADTIGDLLKLGNQIELWGRNHMATPFTKHPNWQEFQESHKRYNSLCEELQNYVKIYPCQLLEDALNNSKTYGYMEFLWFKDGGSHQAKHDEIEAYKNKLLGTYRELG